MNGQPPEKSFQILGGEQESLITVVRLLNIS